MVILKWEVCIIYLIQHFLTVFGGNKLMYYETLSRDELLNEFEKVKSEYNVFKAKGISLDMSRGKPAPEQLDLSYSIFDALGTPAAFTNESGTDCRNYGGLDGLPELKKLFGEILGVDPSLVIVGGNSSLNMMFDTVSQGMTHGFGDIPWSKQEKIKFICPCPGYDRHFAICEYFGMEMVVVESNEFGPDMDKIEELVKDPTFKGMWCVPKYSNPQGIVYSDETVKRIAALKPAAKDFRVFWDNAYVVHGFTEDDDKLLNIYEECLKNGNENLVIQFTSTSKITFPGAGVAAQAAGSEDIVRLKKRMGFQTIGPDKLNHLRHAKVFKTVDDIKNHMKKHAEILRPKFEIVLKTLEENIKPLDIANWTEPKGGYFISLNLPNGLAKRTHTLCKEAGLVMTEAGATYPYGKDPKDSNLRIAPSYPSVNELKLASELLCISIKYAVLENFINK